MGGLFHQDEVLKRLQRMDRFKFEKLVAAMFEKKGYTTTVTPKSGDKGIDIECEKENRVTLIQAKRNSSRNKIGSQEIRNYRTLYEQRDDADRVVVVTSGYFTAPAKELAADLTVEIIDGEDLTELLISDAASVVLDFLEEQEDSERGSEKVCDQNGCESRDVNKITSPPRARDYYICDRHRQGCYRVVNSGLSGHLTNCRNEPAHVAPGWREDNSGVLLCEDHAICGSDECMAKHVYVVEKHSIAGKIYRCRHHAQEYEPQYE